MVFIHFIHLMYRSKCHSQRVMYRGEYGFCMIGSKCGRFVSYHFEFLFATLRANIVSFSLNYLQSIDNGGSVAHAAPEEPRPATAAGGGAIVGPRKIDSHIPRLVSHSSVITQI